ncbi:hypothetical protein Taro_048603 [Colocasia esculenta]|uniref:C2H2-type domain-containing protein n=1 Tax=Colocasia esculenta TaxID=4460 RepID=A0A843X8J8_COLES|nr:hypothetical protein [Colocasia esculenta]
MAAAGANSNSSSAAGGDYPHAIVKGKRTKRMRLLQVLAPRAPHAASSASSSGEQSAGSTTTEEEVDTANSLIMLAERPVVGTVVDSEPRLEEELGGGEGPEAETATGGKAGGIVYQCKTCNKCFPSFQALGGHRASHNKPKAPQQPPATAEMEKRSRDEDGVKVSLASSHKINIGILPGNGGGGTTTPATVTVTTTRSNNHSNGDTSDNGSNHNMMTASSNKPRVHECAICGSEFSSGQALGGHMRRHRAPAPAPAPKKERSILSLDLNLPAPMDDEHASHSFGSSGKRPLIFLPSALVDCHH